MKNPKLTKWFDGSVKPVRDGVYERDYGAGVHAYWRFENGFWRFGAIDSLGDQFIYSADRKSDSQKLPWRGLANNPEVK
jgi:hypothetical protein